MAKVKAKATPAKSKAPAKSKSKKVVVDYGVEMPDGVQDPVSTKEVEDLVAGFIAGEPVVVVSDVPPEERRAMQVESADGTSEVGATQVTRFTEQDLPAATVALFREGMTSTSPDVNKITMAELRARAEAFSNASHNFSFKAKAD